MSTMNIYDLSDTWNAGGTVFSAIKMNVTDTASAAGSLLMDLQVGGVSQFSISKTGALTGLSNAIQVRNSTNAQTFMLYNTFTDASNYERGVMQWKSNTLEIGAEAAGTGSTRQVKLVRDVNVSITMNATSITFQTGSGARNAHLTNTNGFRLNNFGHFQFSSTGAADGLADTGISRAAAAIVRVTNGSTGGGAMEMTQMTAPAAPAANGVRIYAEDDGAGKTRLMARFATGAAQQLAIEP